MVGNFDRHKRWHAEISILRSEAVLDQRQVDKWSADAAERRAMWFNADRELDEIRNLSTRPNPLFDGGYTQFPLDGNG